MLKHLILSLAMATGLSQIQSLPDMYKSVHVVVWVVRDMDKTIAGWQKLGFTEIRIVGNVTFDVRYRSKRATCIVKVAEGHLGDVAVQWIQPLQGTRCDLRRLWPMLTRTANVENRGRFVDRLRGPVEEFGK